MHLLLIVCTCTKSETRTAATRTHFYADSVDGMAAMYTCTALCSGSSFFFLDIDRSNLDYRSHYQVPKTAYRDTEIAIGVDATNDVNATFSIRVLYSFRQGQTMRPSKRRRTKRKRNGKTLFITRPCIIALYINFIILEIYVHKKS